MSKKIYLSPSSQPNNMYAVGNVSEQTQCRKIAAALKAELETCGFTCYAGMDGTMYTRVAESDKLGVDLHMPIHTNAANGEVGGLRIFVNQLGGEAEKIAKAVMETLAPLTPGTSDGISVQSLYEIQASDAICVYLEVGFHDNPEEAKWIIEHTEDIAKAIAEGLCSHYGVVYAGEQKPEAETPAEESYTREQFIREVQAAIGAKVDGIAGTETLGKTVTVSRYINRKHAVVKPIQKRLYALGYTDVGEADGVAGALFQKAVKAYQKDNGCTQDGVITKKNKTWKCMLGML